MKKLQIEDVKNILNSMELCLPDENSAQTTLGNDLSMNDIDMAEMIIDVERLLDIHIPDTMWDKWSDGLSTLTVQQVVDDINTLVC